MSSMIMIYLIIAITVIPTSNRMLTKLPSLSSYAYPKGSFVNNDFHTELILASDKPTSLMNVGGFNHYTANKEV